MAIKGDILIDSDCPSIEDAVVYVYLEDVSNADASAIPVASVSISDVHHTPGRQDRIAFELDEFPSNSRTIYTLRAHVAVHGGDDIRVGDLVTTEFTQINPEKGIQGLNIRVRPV